MTKIMFLLAVMFLSSPVLALTFKVAKPNATANASASKGIATLQSLMKCLKDEKSPSEIKKCSANQLSKNLSDRSKGSLLAWLDQPLELSYPEVCKSEDLDLLPDHQLKKASLFLCSSYKVQGRDEQTVFMMTEEEGQLKLINIRK